MATSKAAARLFYTIRPLLVIAGYMAWIVLAFQYSIFWMVIVPICALLVVCAIWLVGIVLRGRWNEYPQAERPSHD